MMPAVTLGRLRKGGVPLIPKPGPLVLRGATNDLVRLMLIIGGDSVDEVRP